MDRNEEISERRLHKRFQCRNFAVTANYKACPIINISMGGFAFCYSNEEDWPHDTVKQAILFGDSIYLEKVSFYTVSDNFSEEYSSTFIKGRQRGVRFGELTPVQKESLESFIYRLARETS